MLCKPPYEVLVRKGQRSDHGESSFKKPLGGNHRANLPCVKNIQKQGLNDVIFIMAEGEFVAAQFSGNFKEVSATKPGA